MMRRYYNISFVLFTFISIFLCLTGCSAFFPIIPNQTSDTLPDTFKIEVVVKNLNTPWALDFAPDGRLFITERSGRIRVVKNGVLLQEPFATLDVATGGESGLLGLVLDPDFGQNHFLYVAYTYKASDGGLRNRLVRIREDTTNEKGIEDKILLDGARGSGNHDGGRVKFGLDGKLYWTVGDSQSPSTAQDLSSLNGKILRINPDGTIPSDNPFAGSPVYSYGHRNPQGLAWQPGTGRLYETEHGPTGDATKGFGQDEVNLIKPGKNYGWPIIAGNETRQGMVSPIKNSGVSDTWAPSGASFVSSGPWAGSFLFAGLRGQGLYRLMFDQNDPRIIISFKRLLGGEYGRLRDVVEGHYKSIYILTSNRDGRGFPSTDDDRLLRLSWQ